MIELLEHWWQIRRCVRTTVLTHCYSWVDPPRESTIPDIAYHNTVLEATQNSTCLCATLLLTKKSRGEHIAMCSRIA